MPRVYNELKKYITRKQTHQLKCGLWNRTGFSEELQMTKKRSSKYSLSLAAGEI